MTATVQQPADFVERKFKEGATYFSLAVSLPEGRTTLLDRYAAELGAREVLDRIEDRAHRHAQLGPTVALFVVEAVQESDGKKESLGCELFRVSANPPGSRGIMTEPANEVGLLSQMMRHNEANQRLMIGSVSSLLEHMGMQLQAAAKRDDDAQAARLRMMEVTESMISQQHARKLAEEEQAAKLALKREGFQKLLTTGQTIATAVLSKKGGEMGGEVGAAMAVVRLFETLDQDQLMQLLGALKPEQQALVMGFVKDLISKRQKDGETDGQTTH